MSQHATKPVTHQRRLRSAGTSAQSDQSSLIARAFYSLRATKRGVNKNPCYTGWIYRLIWWLHKSYSGFCRRGGSNEYTQSMFWSRNKKNNVPCKPQFYYIKWGLMGSKLYRYAFVIYEYQIMRTKKTDQTADWYSLFWTHMWEGPFSQIKTHSFVNFKIIRATLFEASLA